MIAIGDGIAGIAAADRLVSVSCRSRTIVPSRGTDMSWAMRVGLSSVRRVVESHGRHADYVRVRRLGVAGLETVR